MEISWFVMRNDTKKIVSKEPHNDQGAANNEAEHLAELNPDVLYLVLQVVGACFSERPITWMTIEEPVPF
jgi:hypothetical protein